MKRKTFKKALAGISAAAMLVSAMPMTLIADAYSSVSLVNINKDTLATFASMADSANGQDSRYMYADTEVSLGKYDQVKFNSTDKTKIVGHFDELGTFDVKQFAEYQYEEVYATQSPTGPEDKTTVLSAKFDFAQAEADLIEALAQKGNDRIVAIEFYEDEENDKANFGKIKSVTMDMPVTTGNGGVNEWSHEVIKFTVVRSADDFNAFVSAQGSEPGHIILAESFSVGGSKQVSFTGDVDINLNGYELTAPNGLQVVGAKMRLWNGTIKANSTGASTTSALGAYSEYSTIELYDDVTINHQADTSGAKAAIAGQGKLVFCGDAVQVITGGASVKAIDTTENLSVQAGDYEYEFDGAGGFGAYNATTAKDAHQIETQKIHKYNQYGFEVADRGTAATDAVIEASTNYVDVDARTTEIEYGYEPAKETVAEVTSDVTYEVENLGQLYWAAEMINSNNIKYKADKTQNLTVKITKSLDFDNAPGKGSEKLKWTPIEARTWASGKTLTITGESTVSVPVTGSSNVTNKTYAVLKNMKVEEATGNGAFISEAGADNANTNQVVIQNLGFENATVSAPNGYASVVVGEAYNTEINHVYVNNSQATASVTGSKVGVMAGYLKNSKIDHTYTASKSAALYSLDSTTIDYLIQNGTKTAKGLTNFYDSDLYTSAGATAVYFVKATSKQLTNGEVAYRLNGHNPAQEADTPLDWDNGGNANSCTVDTNETAPYNGNYATDVFGQIIGEYPTFIQGAEDGTGKNATNRVYRVIAKKCTGTTEAWAKTGATFSNTELDPTKGSHVGTTVCSVCGAYKISTDNFDPVLIPYLSDTDTTKTYNENNGVDRLKNGNSLGDDGWLCPKELLGGKVNATTTLSPLTTVIIDLTKADSTKTVDEIIAQIYSTTNPLKGWDILNATKIETDGTLTPGTTPKVKDVRFVVEDSVVCRLDTDGSNDDTAINPADGFLVASGFAASKFAAEDANWKKADSMKAGYKVDSKVDTSTVVTVDETPSVLTDNINSFYVSADQNDTVTGSERVNAKADGIKDATKGVNGKVAYPTASFKDDGGANAINYTIIFSGVKHNELSTDKANGVYNSAKLGAASYDGKTVVVSNNKIVVGTDEHGAPTYGDGSTHNYVGIYCDCVLETKDCNSKPSTINGLTHEITCSDCNHSSDAVVHDFEVLFTIGNVTVKRCMGCGYVTAAKETIITASTPVLSRPDFYDDTNKVTSKYFRQSYDFSIAAGDGEIVNYGVIYKKNPTDESAIDSTKLQATPTGNYFAKNSLTNVITLNTDVLKEAGVNYTSRKGVKSNLTYRANFSVANVDDVVELAGYVIYKDYSGNYGLKVTPITSQSFEDVAYAEIENSNVIAEAEHYVKAGNADREVFPYTFDIADDCKFINYGVLLTTNTTTPVTADTTLADADPTINTANGIKSAKKAPSSDAIKSLTYAPSMTMKAGNTGTIRAYAVVEKYDLEWTIYTDVQSYTKP